MLTGRDILIYKSIKYAGDVRAIVDSLSVPEEYDEDQVKQVINSVKCKICTYLDDDYPEYLKTYRYPPLVLYYYGDISLINEPNKCLAIVGSRAPSEYGLRATKTIVRDLANKYVIVSGMASGIDACAQDSTLFYGGKTVAVLGSGIDYCYPIENLSLYNRIKENGLVISEYPGLTTPDAVHFPFRNRLIAYTSKGILITEAREKSGTLITVSWASSFTKEVMCIPHQINEGSACNKLIKEGAALVENGEDVIDIMEGHSNDNQIVEP